MRFQWNSGKRAAQMLLIVIALFTFMGVGDEDDRFRDLGHHLMCVCGCNQILLECNHVGCSYSTRMRDELTAAVTRGDSDTNVLQWFIQNYGTTVLAVPTASGFNRLAWIMPYFALIFGITLVTGIVWVWKKRPLPADPSVPAAVDGHELDRFRRQARTETEL